MFQLTHHSLNFSKYKQSRMLIEHYGNSNDEEILLHHPITAPIFPCGLLKNECWQLPNIIEEDCVEQAEEGLCSLTEQSTHSSQTFQFMQHIICAFQNIDCEIFSFRRHRCIMVPWMAMDRGMMDRMESSWK